MTRTEGKDWVMDIDLKSFFDEVNQNLLMYRVGQGIRDKGMLRLIGRYLRSGGYEEGRVRTTTRGVPQGGPLSPLLANIYLDSAKQMKCCNLHGASWPTARGAVMQAALKNQTLKAQGF